jgi:catechol 2,3-dioxygenase-like lactoylglutathione lyase family enzyme
MSEDQYRDFRHQTLWELGEGAPSWVWEIYGDTGNWFPDAGDDKRAAWAGRLLRELRSEGWATVVRRSVERGGDEDHPLTDGEFEQLMEGDMWRPEPPVPMEASEFVLVPTKRILDWQTAPAARRRVFGLDHCVIAVSDWDRSNAFYRDVLGAELIELDKGRYAYRFGEHQLNVHGPGAEPHPRAADPVKPGNSDLCFVWDGSIEDAVGHLEAHGIEPELGPVERTGAQGRGTSVYFRDPDGSLLELISYTDAAP